MEKRKIQYHKTAPASFPYYGYSDKHLLRYVLTGQGRYQVVLAGMWFSGPCGTPGSSPPANEFPRRHTILENVSTLICNLSSSGAFRYSSCAGGEKMERKRAMERPSDSLNLPSTTIADLSTDQALRRHEIILEGEKRALALAVNGAALQEVLDVLTLCAERQSADNIMASIMILDKDGQRIWHGSAPHLPRDYIQAISGRTVGPGAGSCGTAAFLKREVIVSNIATNPLWDKYRDFALSNGLAACWSKPIFSSRGEVLATFAIYYDHPQSPGNDDRTAIELLARTAGIIIEWFREIEHRQHAEEAVRKSDQQLRALMTATTDVIYRMSADWKKMWTLYGQNFLADTTDAIDGWQEKYLLPEDRKAVEVAIHEAIKNRSLFQLEHRVLQADGSIGWTLSRAVPIFDSSGNITEWYGLATDITQRKRYETSLAETLSLFESILSNAPVGYALFNEQHEYLHVNDALAAINGISAQEHIGKRVTEILPASSQDIHGILDLVFQTAKPVQNIEIRGALRTKPGIEGTWLVTFYPVIIDHSDDVKYVGAAVLEITDRIQAEQRLKASEKQFRDFSNSIQNLAWMAHGDGWIYWCNQRWYDYTGTTLEQMEGWRWTTLLHPDHLKRTEAFISKAWQKGVAWELTFPLRNRNGEYRWFLTRAVPIRDEAERVVRWIGTNTDIDEKLQFQARLEESENRLRQISDFMPQIVWSTDAVGNHDFFNKRWYEFTGFTYEETRDEKWTSAVHPDDLDRLFEIWTRCLASGELYETEYRVRRKDGQYRWILARAMPLRKSDGTIERWFGSSTDIHDQKTMAEKLEELVHERTMELLRSNADLQQFAHVASHDLKEPVRKILLFADTIAGRFGDALPQQVTGSIARIQKSAHRLASMIEGVLLYSSLDGAPVQAEDVDLNLILHEIVDDLELVIDSKNAKIIYGTMPIIKGAPTLIYQLFYNLINNALKFSHEARRPMIEVSSGSVTRDRVSFHEIIVADNGIGFNNVHAEKIFSTFTRLHRKDQYEGTGLGLALCKKIVERHRGSISATGTEGQGARFRILLPA